MTDNKFNPDWDAMAVMVEEQQRMARRIEELTQREWVGLTNAEVNMFSAGCNNGNSVQDSIRKAEAKLKEKNSTTEKNIQISDKND
jgi:hypothetical protein